MFGSVPGVTPEDVLILSRVCACFLIFLYISFIYFHLKTHKDSFQHHNENEAENPEDKPMTTEDLELSQLSLTSSVLLMVASITVAAFNSQVLVDHLQDLSQTFGVPTKFIGATLLPILGKPPLSTLLPCFMPRRKKSTLQYPLPLAPPHKSHCFVVPLSVLWGWAFDRPMSLDFTGYDSAVMLLGTFLVAQMLQHGVSVWLHGAMLMNVYLMIAVISYFEPN